MSFVLIMFWWGHSAAQLNTIKFESAEMCEQAKTQIVQFQSKEARGDFAAVCVQVK